MKALIVADDFVNRRYIGNFLEQFGEIDIAVDGTEAVDAFLAAVEKKEYYDLVCLDIMMPNTNGVEALESMRAIEAHYQVDKKNRSKIIMMSALTEKEYIQKASRLGCNGYANKPVSLKKLREVLRKMKLVEQ